MINYLINAFSISVNVFLTQIQYHNFFFEVQHASETKARYLL